MNLMSTPNRGQPHHSVELDSGTLNVYVDRTEMPLEDLCGFASRRNKKRGFLFVSKVLGRHIPVRAGLMSHTHRLLAQKLSHLPGPVVFIGMAETAIALGHGVHDQYVDLTGRDDTMFIQTTRYRLDQPVAVQFLEEHSHAPSHILYRPIDPHCYELFTYARTLVLVDDEASTGKTFINLARELTADMPCLERVVTAVITDWRSAEHRDLLRTRMPVPNESISILDGGYDFTPNPNADSGHVPSAIGTNELMDDRLTINFGRLGTKRPRHIRNIDSLGDVSGQRILVLGTGEFAYPPFLLALELEKRGAHAFCQSTTRSPVALGGAIGCALTFADNYGDGIANYLYNARKGDYDRIIICSETPSHLLDNELVEALEAEVLEDI